MIADRQAGVLGLSPALDTDPERLTAMFEVNVVGPLRMIQAFAPALSKAAGSGFGSGSRPKILNIGSVLSNAAPWHTGYSSTKVSHVLSRCKTNGAGSVTGDE